MSLTILDGRKMTNRRTAHDYLAETLSLPDYYGRNLDALHDCLSERSGEELILIRHASCIRAELLGYGDTLIEVFQDVSEAGGPTVIVTEH